MSLRHVPLFVLLLVPALVRGEEAPEQLLSAKSQLYLRWDGGKAHEAAFKKTALGKMMQGDTGKMVDNLFSLLKEQVTTNVAVKGLLDGLPAAKVQAIKADVDEASKILDLLNNHGIIVAGEVTSVVPAPGGQVTVIVPDCAKGGPLFAVLRLIGQATEAKMNKSKIDGREVEWMEQDQARIGWWTEGKHAVVVVTTDKIESAVKKMTSSNHARLPSNALYKRLKEFKEFDTSARAFFDIEPLTKIAMAFGKEVKEVVESLGLDGLKAVTFISGYEGEAERGITEVHYSGPRKGLLALMSGKPFKLADVPALPHDVISWNMTSFDAAATFDAVLKAAETIAMLIDPNEAKAIKGALEQLDQALGVSFRNDILGALGDRVLQYSSPSEGVFTLSQTIAIKVKTPDKLMDNLDQAVKGLAQFAGGKVSVKKRKYRGVDMREVRVNQQGFFFLPTYSIVDGWLVLGFYPQSVQGFILRSKGEIPVWKPDEAVEASLNKMPREFLSIGVSDPRPSVKQLFALAPLVGSGVRSLIPESKFDPGLIPNANEACKHLFPNVTVVSDEGKSIRMHTRASLALPFDIAGLDSYILAFGGIGLFSAFDDK